MWFFYNLFILAYTAFIYIVSPFNRKAALWVKGRRGWAEAMSGKFDGKQRRVWIHCASLGEFEQGRPVIERIRDQYPDACILITFFSPSGYEIRKNWQYADHVSYLPADTPGNARRLIEIVRPSVVIFIKYEFWSNYISEISRKGIPLYLISGIFREDQHFFRWYGSFFRKILKKFTWLFVQDEISLGLLHKTGLQSCDIVGDTRFDRVVEIAAAAEDVEQIAAFRGEEKLFIAGSSWEQDEVIISQYINKNPGKMKWVFAPHNIERSNIDRLEKLFSVRVARFSEHGNDIKDARVLIIDNIGLLSRIYRYAYIASIGGGFGRGIHNILEAACWGIPVMFGPNHKKFREAVELLNEKGAVTFNNYESFELLLEEWLSDRAFYLKSAKSASDYINKNTGATGKILEKIFPKDIDIRGSKLV